MSTGRTVTARNVIATFCELRRLAPSLNDWTEAHFASNPPRLYRLQQLIALARVFDIPLDPDGFVRGEFVRPHMPKYDPLISQLTEGERRGARLPDREHLGDFFRILLEYREQLDGVLRFSGGVKIASGLYLVAHQRIAEINERIRNQLPLVDELLAAVIDPEMREIEVAEMVRKYGYPDVDLLDVDIAWW